MRPQITFADFFESVWLKVPEVWRNADQDNGKALQILVYTMCQHMYYYFYQKISSMDELFDIDRCPDKYLKFIASMISWDLIGNDPDSWRAQLRAAPLLFKIKGTEKSIVIAEKLIGYSVYMADLYRDYLGNFVQKENIFNSMDLGTTVKPWFKNNPAPDISKEIFNPILSDSFSPYNSDTAYLDAQGNIILNRQLQEGDFVTNGSTEADYDNITGTNSLARFSKIPRINLVLKKDKELDYIDPITGKKTEANLDEAINLLLQFKPFHVVINNLEVLYDLSDYIFGYSLDKTAGIGNSGDSILSRESPELNLAIPDKKEDKIIYGSASINQTQYKITTINAVQTNSIYLGGSLLGAGTRVMITSTGAMPDGIKKDIIYYIVLTASVGYYRLADSYFSFLTSTTISIGPSVGNGDIYAYAGNCLIDSLNSAVFPVDNKAYNKGYLSADYNILSLADNSITPEIDIEKISSFGFSLNGYVINDVIQKGKKLLYYGDITSRIDNLSPPAISPAPEETDLFLSTNNAPLSTKNDVNIKVSSYDKDISTYTFLVIPYNQQKLKSAVDLKSYFGKVINNIFVPFSAGDVTNISLDVLNRFYKDSITINFPDSTSDTQSYLNNNPWNLSQLSAYLSASSALSRNSLPLNSNINLLKDIINNTFTLVLEFIDPLSILSSQKVLLYSGIHYKIDYKNNNIILNTYEIISNLLSIDLLSIRPGTIDKIFLSNSKLHIININKKPFDSAINLDSRTRNYNISTRKHKEFNRIYWKLSDVNQTYIDTAYPKVEYVFDDASGTLIEDSQRTKLFKSDLPYLYARNGLHKEQIGPYNAVNYNSRSPRDITKWEVDSELFTATYLGPELVGKNFWGNYFQAPFPSSGQLIPYTSVDTSFDSQEAHRTSLRWQQISTTIEDTNPDHFLTNRKNTKDRNSIWTRGSYKKMPLPYKGYSRANQQYSRGSKVLFNRIENLPDYSISTQLVDYSLSKYKYQESLTNMDSTDSWLNPTIDQTDSIIPNTENRTISNLPVYNTTIDGSGTLITYPILENLSLGYTPLYQYAFDFTSRDKYFVNNTNKLKPSFYAGNLVINSCPYENSLLNEASDTLNSSISGLTSIEDLFLISSSTETEFILTHTNPYIAWTRTDNGDTVNIGFFPLINPYLVRSSLRVFKNGIELDYAYKWSIADDFPRVILAPSVPVIPGDLIKIYYDTIDGQPLPTTPYDASLANRIFDSAILTSNDVNNSYNYEFILSKYPAISWYRSDTGQFINCCILDSNSNQFPYPKAYKLLAINDVIVRRNGSIIEYLKGWEFRYYPLESPHYRIRILSNIMDLCVAGDNITVEYTTLM